MQGAVLVTGGAKRIGRLHVGLRLAPRVGRDKVYCQLAARQEQSRDERVPSQRSAAARMYGAAEIEQADDCKDHAQRSDPM